MGEQPPPAAAAAQRRHDCRPRPPPLPYRAPAGCSRLTHGISFFSSTHPSLPPMQGAVRYHRTMALSARTPTHARPPSRSLARFFARLVLYARQRRRRQRHGRWGSQAEPSRAERAREGKRGRCVVACFAVITYHDMRIPLPFLPPL
ncbi:hypothetical protein JDV02_010866 [Purpureocillium takamizusanense]|uniref:Uncharacterized protein n=1 Tax=Purpureocillium takamizusanense TaxID=2060973 RepID=A0A9Q8QJE0_9HYPO|nr:uncharacterized protein JDV02_010866 [Purpureocillium takamizusanense]UNI20938.1 hypothetical protein JDV02_010866 [Purpureocillium takamizusanense]